ncbi:hypothetical protein HAZT_HAZT008497 [Hyalella azteca]|uniref:Vesicle-associated membrane protein 7 n=1 Tax=Hyalella azteca TaxID=294128 RepID=A0A6A0GV25_HYAAZ|nr:hypothetical protein HAZT_HAZT008497 [Hyalella azteca]
MSCDRYASCAGNFQDVAEQVLSRVASDPASAPRMTFTHAQYLIHYIISSGVNFLCITDSSFDRYRSFLFLEDIKSRFLEAYQASPKDATPYAWNDSFCEILEQRMESHNNNPNTDAVRTMKLQLEDVQQTLDRNIEELTSRGERLELLVDKTNNLNSASVTFRVQSREVARRAWWTNVKFAVPIVIFVLISIYLLSAAICGFAWDKCGNS